MAVLYLIAAAASWMRGRGHPHDVDEAELSVALEEAAVNA